jgi:hypothetical protein
MTKAKQDKLMAEDSFIILFIMYLSQCGTGGRGKLPVDYPQKNPFFLAPRESDVGQKVIPDLTL